MELPTHTEVDVLGLTGQIENRAKGLDLGGFAGVLWFDCPLLDHPYGAQPAEYLYGLLRNANFLHNGMSIDARI